MHYHISFIVYHGSFLYNLGQPFCKHFEKGIPEWQQTPKRWPCLLLTKCKQSGQNMGQLGWEEKDLGHFLLETCSEFCQDQEVLL